MDSVSQAATAPTGQKTSYRAFLSKIGGTILLIIGIIGTTVGAIVSNGTYLPGIGLYSGLFTIACGITGLLAFFDEEEVFIPVTVCCTMLVLVDIATVWVQSISLQRAGAWCDLIRSVNATHPLSPQNPVICTDGHQSLVTTCQVILVVLAVVGLVTAGVISFYGISKNFGAFWRKLIAKSKGDVPAPRAHQVYAVSGLRGEDNGPYLGARFPSIAGSEIAVSGSSEYTGPGVSDREGRVELYASIGHRVEDESTVDTEDGNHCPGKSLTSCAGDRDHPVSDTIRKDKMEWLEKHLEMLKDSTT